MLLNDGKEIVTKNTVSKSYPHELRNCDDTHAVKESPPWIRFFTLKKREKKRFGLELGRVCEGETRIGETITTKCVNIINKGEIIYLIFSPRMMLVTICYLGAI